MKKKYILSSILILILISIILSNISNNKIFIDDTLIAINVNGVLVNSFPAKGNYSAKVDCNNALGRWDYDTWEAVIKNIGQKSRCNFTFTSVTPVSYVNFIKTKETASGVWNEPSTDWRYQGKNPDNYLYFNGELWRAIGVFQDNTHDVAGQELVKIIRVNPLGPFSWQANNRNDWNDSAGSLRTLLNDFYLYGLDGTANAACRTGSSGSTVVSHCDFRATGITDVTYRNMIQSVTWRLGGHNANAPADTFYTSERGTAVSSAGRPTTWNGNIGLMYPSDYGYSVLASSCTRLTNLSAYNTATCAGQSWLFSGAEWSLTPNSSVANYVYCMSNQGSGSLEVYAVGSGLAARPTLYLKSDVMYLAGNGSIDNPHIIIQ